MALMILGIIGIKVNPTEPKTLKEMNRYTRLGDDSMAWFSYYCRICRDW